MSLQRGCVCCSLRSDLVDALKTLEGRAASTGTPFDAVLLETTGVADPGPVVFTFFANSWISARYRLDSVLCLVDAQHISKLLDERSPDALDEAVNQIAFADTILLNKIDLVSDEELQQARDVVRAVNMTANVIECQLGGDDALAAGSGAEGEAPPRPNRTVGWADVMDVNSFSIERARQVDPTFMSGGGDAEGSGDDECGDDDDDGGEETGDGGRLADDGGTSPPDAARKRGRSNDTDAATAPAAKAAAAPGDGGAPARRVTRKRLHDLAGVSSVGISAPGPLDQYRFNMFMKDLLLEKVGARVGRVGGGVGGGCATLPLAGPARAHHPDPRPPFLVLQARDIMRCKGVLCIHGQEDTKFVFQGVHDTVCFGPAASGWGDGDRASQIVFIGRDLDRRTLADGFASCVWAPLPAGWSEHVDARSGRPYYVQASSGGKQWSRPAGEAAAGVVASQAPLRPDAPKVQAQEA